MPVEPVPEGHHAVTPYLVVENVSEFVEFLAKAFGATVKERVARARRLMASRASGG